MKPHRLALLVFPLLLSACSVHIAPYRFPSEGDEVALVGEGAVAPDPTGVSQAVMAAKLRLTLKNPDLMGQDATFEALKPYLVLTLPSRPQTFKGLEEAAGQKILSLGKYPMDLVPEDDLLYATTSEANSP